jgi:predicted CoA-binding protein
MARTMEAELADLIEQILTESKSITVVGLSPKPERDSHREPSI